MRTTIRLDDALLREAKARAARNGRSLSEFIEEAVRNALLRVPAPRPAPALPVFGGGALCPGVSLDSGADLLDLMHERDRLR
jgi:plasmid stability protein